METQTNDIESISSDHPCWNCGYNVRGLSPYGRCPECGAAIDLSRLPRANKLGKVGAFLASFAILVLLLGTVLVDLATAATVYWEFALTVWLIAAILAIPTWRLTKRLAPLVMFAAITLALLVLPFVPWPPTKPYRAFHACINKGMTQAQIVTLLDRHFQNRAFDGRPTITRRSADHIIMVLDPNNGRYNAEVIYVYFKNNRVVSKQYSPD